MTERKLNYKIRSFTQAQPGWQRVGYYIGEDNRVRLEMRSICLWMMVSVDTGTAEEMVIVALPSGDPNSSHNRDLIDDSLNEVQTESYFLGNFHESELTEETRDDLRLAAEAREENRPPCCPLHESPGHNPIDTALRTIMVMESESEEQKKDVMQVLLGRGAMIDIARKYGSTPIVRPHLLSDEELVVVKEYRDGILSYEEAMAKLPFLFPPLTGKKTRGLH